MSLIGKQILHYEIKKMIGEGGMGNVYLAEHVKLGRMVAIKSLHERLANNESIRERFKKEASTMAHLQHPAIVALYDYLEEADGLYLVMEFVDGTALDDYIRKVTGPVPEERALKLMKQILTGFAYAHDQGIVHRDIKPSNILLTKDERCKILDFGIAKLLSEVDKKLTKTGTQVGTIYYMCPEQVRGENVDQRSDIYSLGVTFFQLLTGTNPYKDLTTEYEIYNKIVNEPLPNASTVYPAVSSAMEQVLAKATAKNPADRFQSCREFLAAVENIERTPAAPAPFEKTVVVEQQPDFEKTVAFDRTNPQVTPTPKPTYQSDAALADAPPSAKKSNGNMIGIIGGVLAVIAIIVIVVINSGGSNEDTAIAEKRKKDSLETVRKNDSIAEAKTKDSTDKAVAQSLVDKGNAEALKKRADSLIQVGDKLLKQKKWKEAKDAYTAAKQVDPSNTAVDTKIAEADKGLAVVPPPPVPTVVTGPTTKPQPEPTPGSGTVYQTYDVDVKPTYSGGYDAMSAFISRNLKYPSYERENEITGTVMIVATVEKDGRLSNVRASVEVKNGPGLTKEAIRLVKSMPAWNPGKIGGQSVRTDQKIPIKFQL
ncbi:MAG: protein kinase [Bacteroidetes bacterium]|nr:protein kinase [Bacteroidota bacterium]